MKYLTLAAGAMALSLCSVVAQAKGPNGVDTGSAMDCSVVQRGWKLRECERLAAEQEAAQLAEDEAARLAAEQEAARLAEAEAARLAAEQEAAAQETVLSWSIPTTRQNGELLSPSELAAYEIYITADQSGGEQVIVVNDPMQTSYTIVGLAPDTYHFAISAVDVDGLRSELSIVVDKTIAASVAAL